MTREQLEKSVKALEREVGGLQGQLYSLEEVDAENAALRRRIGDLSNALEAAFRHLQYEQERDFDPDREVLTTLIYMALNPAEKPEGGEG